MVASTLPLLGECAQHGCIFLMCSSFGFYMGIEIFALVTEQGEVISALCNVVFRIYSEGEECIWHMILELRFIRFPVCLFVVSFKINIHLLFFSFIRRM